MLSAASRPLASPENFQVFAEHFHFKFFLKGRSRAHQWFKLIQSAGRGWFSQKKTKNTRVFKTELHQLQTMAKWLWLMVAKLKNLNFSSLLSTHSTPLELWQGQPQSYEQVWKGSMFYLSQERPILSVSLGVMVPGVLAWAVDRRCLKHSSPFLQNGASLLLSYWLV